MYDIEIKLRADQLRGRGPFVMPDIKTVSITSARIILTNGNDQLYTFRPDEIISIGVWPKKGETYDRT